VSSNPIIILEDIPSVTITPDTNTPPRSPPQEPEKRPRPERYTGMATRSSSRTKKSFSPRHRGGSRRNPSQEKIDTLGLSGDADHTASASRGTFGPEEILSPPQSVTLEEHSLQPDDNMALADSHLPVKSSVSTAEENPQHVPPAPEMFPTHKKAYPVFSTDEQIPLAGIPFVEIPLVANPLAQIS
jgi:hypothetical protein